MKTIPEARRWIRKFTAPFRRVRAFAGGYFWSECDLCGEPFGGFEFGSHSIPNDKSGHYYLFTTVCRMESCQREAERRTVDHFRAGPQSTHVLP